MDEATIMQTRLIAVETAIEKLNKAVDLMLTKETITGIQNQIKELDIRIKTLEDARVRQIALNQTFQIKPIPVITPQVISDKKSIWNLFK